MGRCSHWCPWGCRRGQSLAKPRQQQPAAPLLPGPRAAPWGSPSPGCPPPGQAIAPWSSGSMSSCPAGGQQGPESAQGVNGKGWATAVLGPGQQSLLPGEFPKWGWLFPAATAPQQDTGDVPALPEGWCHPSCGGWGTGPPHRFPQLGHRAAPVILWAVPPGLLPCGWGGQPNPCQSHAGTGWC